MIVDRCVRSLVLVTLLAVPMLSITELGCGPGQAIETPVAEDTLRSEFPAHAARVVDGPSAFAATSAGFAIPTSSTVVPRALRASLPKTGRDPVRLEMNGFAVNVLESGLGADSEGKVVGSAVAYAREGGTSYWSATDKGYEEWLRLEPGIATGGAPVASWQVDGARLHQDGDVVGISDANDVVRMRVSAPEAWTTDGAPVAARLTVRGSTIELWVDSGGAAVLVDPAWVAVGQMSSARGGQTQVVLQNGKVLAAGGTNDTNVLASAELYNPTTTAWEAAPSMNTVREGHQATLLANGKVLATGGDDGLTTFASTELYDPATNSWTPAAPMLHARSQHTATLLPSGKVFVVGGRDDDHELNLAEIYDPATDSWTASTSALAVRYGHSATLLASGKVLTVGGGDFTVYYASAEIYDPAADTWAAAGTLTGGARDSHSATLLSTGKVLVAGGTNLNSLATVTLYDPATNTWTPAPPMAKARRLQGSALLAGDKVLQIGGASGNAALASVEQYDAATNAWSAGSALLTVRYGCATSVLSGGIVLVAGGFNMTSALSTAERYSPGAGALGATCNAGGACASGSCVDGVCCDTPCVDGTCSACTVAKGATADGTCTVLTGRSCDDGNALTKNDVCTANGCAGAPLCTGIVCTPMDQCHAAGTCDPGTGTCSNPAQADNTPCNDGSALTKNDVCTAGACAGVPLCTGVVCTPFDQCHVAGTCDPGTGTCSNPAQGDSTPCNDGSALTKNDVCTAGACSGVPLCMDVVCAPTDQCHVAGTCDPGTGVCSNPTQSDNTPCNDGDAVTKNDVCTAGACAGVLLCTGVVCPAPDQCHLAGTCDPGTGVCSNPAQGDKTACDDGNPLTKNDVCAAGVCAGAPLCADVVCKAIDECHDVGTCDSNSGKCSIPKKADGSACGGGTCKAGVCVATPDSGAGDSGTDSGAPAHDAGPTESRDSGVPNSNPSPDASTTASTDAKAEGASGDDGCSCVVAGGSQRDQRDRRGWLAMAGLGLVVVRRRRAARSPSVR